MIAQLESLRLHTVGRDYQKPRRSMTWKKFPILIRYALYMILPLKSKNRFFQRGATLETWPKIAEIERH